MDKELEEKLKTDLANPEFDIDSHIKGLQTELDIYTAFSKNPQAVSILETLGWSFDSQLDAGSCAHSRHDLLANVWKTFKKNVDVVAKFCDAGWSLEDQNKFISKMSSQCRRSGGVFGACDIYNYLARHSEAIIALKNAGFEIKDQMEKCGYAYMDRCGYEVGDSAYMDGYEVSDSACMLENYQTAIVLSEAGVDFDEQLKSIKEQGKEYYTSPEVQQLVADVSHHSSFVKKIVEQGKGGSGVQIGGSKPLRNVREEARQAGEPN